MHMDRYTYDLL